MGNWGLLNSGISICIGAIWKRYSSRNIGGFGLIEDEFDSNEQSAMNLIL